MIILLRQYLAEDGLGPLLVKSITGSGGLRVLGMAFGFLVGVQLARGLGPEGYGIYGLAMSIIALLSVVTEFGLPQLLTREIAAAQVKREWGYFRGLLRWSTRSSMILAAVAGVALVAWLAWQDMLGTRLGDTLIAGVVMVPLVALLSLRGAALRATQRIFTGQLAEITLRPAFHSVLLYIVPLVLFPLTPALAMWLGVVAVASALTISHLLLYRALPPSVLSARHEAVPGGWWYSALPLAMTEGMGHLQAHLLIFLLGGMVAISDVGIFRMATSVLLLIGMPISLFNIVCMPLIARLHTRGEKSRIRQMLKWVTLAMLGGVVLLSLPFLLGGSRLLAFVFGNDFAGGSPVLAVLCIGVITTAAFGLNAPLLNMTGHQTRVTFASAIALAVLLVLSPPMISRGGIMGAAVSSVLSVLTWNLLIWQDCRRLLDIDPGIWASFSVMKR